MSLTVFTSCYGLSYARWLPSWEAALRFMQPRVEAVVVGDEYAQLAWGGTARFILAPEHGEPYNQGAAHNAAATACRTEWVMHVGVDDIPMPNLAATLEPHLAEAEVVAVDVQRMRGNERAGIRENRPTRELILRPTMGKQPLDACAAFRLSWWDMARYREDLVGGVDVALWIDLARLGARFTWTGRVGVLYRLREDSLWHSRSQENVRQVRRALNQIREGTL